MRVKVCGIARTEDLRELASLGIDYCGFIFYEGSPRYVADKISGKDARALSGKIKKTGVFVNAQAKDILRLAEEYELDLVQLHGDEPPEFCTGLGRTVPVMKAFRIAEDFDMEKELKPYAGSADYFLFDAPGKKYGGHGVSFNWDKLQAYEGDTPFFLGGGIGPEHAALIRQLDHPRLYAADINSRFETRPGEKDMERIKQFLWDLNIS